MAELRVCVSLESTTVDEMVDEAARANLSGADMVEIRFDRLWLDKPEPEIVEDENGRTREVMSLENTWTVNDLEHVEIEAALDRLACEVGAVEKTDPKKATEKLECILSATASGTALTQEEDPKTALPSDTAAA